MGNQTTQKTTAYLLIAPAVGLLLAIVAGPLAYSFILSFHYQKISDQFVGLQNYWRLLHDPTFITSLVTTLYYIVGVTSIDLAIGLLLAYVMNVKSRIQGVIRVAIFLPMFTAPVVMGLAWRYMYNAEYGIIDYLLRSVGLPGPLWLSNVHVAIWAIIIADVYETAPFAGMMFLTALQTVPKQLYEAAKTDSASPLQSFRHITLPYLAPAFTIILIVRTIEVFKIFDIVYVLTGGGPAGVTESLSIFTYTNMVEYLEYGYASAASWLMVGMSLGLSFMYIRQLRRRRT